MGANMDMHDQSPTPGGRAFLYGGIAAGVLVLVLLLTHGFGLFAPRPAAEAPPALVRKGQQLFVPESSPLRQRLAVEAAPAQETTTIIRAPANVETDPTHLLTVLPPGAGRVREVKVNVGERVQRGQLLALIDSPDLAQAYADNDKARAAAVFARKSLNYQEEQFKIGAAAQSAVDAARNDNEQAVAEYARSRAHLRALGAAEDARGDARLLAIRAPVAGSITALSIAPGATINDDTQPILTLQDLHV